MRAGKSLFALLFGGLAASATAQPADVTVEFLPEGEHAWYVQSQSPPDAGVVTETGSGNLNPTLSLEIGKRYTFINTDTVIHPFAIFASGPPNDLLLRQAATGTMEDDPDVNWENDPQSDMTFTLTPQLADALQSEGRTPSYMCEAHPMMSGDIVFTQQPSPFQWPAGTETFENAALGENVTDAFADWVMVAGSADFTATIEETPEDDPGEADGSTRWLTVVDDDPGGDNRLYPPTVTAEDEVDSYTFTWLMNVQSVGGDPFLVIAQHLQPSVANLGGIEVSGTGVDAILLGANDGGIGKPGDTVREPLYSYADSGGFGMNNWVAVSFTVDLENGELSVEATGSDGATTSEATITGLELQNDADPGVFRWCIRNNTPGSVSTVSYDNLAFTGEGTPPTSVEGWIAY